MFSFTKLPAMISRLGDAGTITPNALDAIRREVTALLARECSQTTMSTRIPHLVDTMAMTHTANTGQLRRIRTHEHLEKYMLYTIGFGCILRRKNDINT